MRIVVLMAVVLAASLAHGKAAVNEPAPVDTASAVAPGALASGIGASRTFGLGLYLGQPVGITAKYFAAPNFGVAFLVGSWLARSRGLVGEVDALYHVRDLIPKSQAVELGLYFGAGGGLGYWTRRLYYHEHTKPWPHWHQHDVNQLLVYLKPTLGGALMLRKAPIEIFAEIAPTYRLTPDADVDFGGALGGRYYF